MSFASDAKNEITQRRIAKDCCACAACYGIACFAKYFDTRGLVLQTELEAVAQYARRLFSRCEVQGSIEEKPRASGVVYEFGIKEAEQVRRLHALFGTSGNETNLQIDPRLLKCQGCVSTFVASAFLCSGTVTDPSKEYNLEILTPRYHLSRDFEALLAEHEFAPHRTTRKGVNVVYVKASGHVEDLLTFMGAAGASLKLMDEKVLKSVRNHINRQTNCDTANLGKTARANAGTLKAIRYLVQENALEGLPAPLREAAQKRMENPDLSLAALGRLFEPELSKAGLCHRMKKLETLAADLQRRQAERRMNERESTNN